MRSIQGPISINFYKSNLENKTFNSIKKLLICLKYVDDILILANDINSECPFQYKKAYINNLISGAKLISYSKTIKK